MLALEAATKVVGSGLHATIGAVAVGRGRVGLNMPFPPDSPLGKLTAQFPRAGQLTWIGVRPARETAMHVVDVVDAVAGAGLAGDRYRAASGKRGVTLIQFEHLAVIAALCGIERVEPRRLRRNLVVRGIPLVALVGRRFRIGAVEMVGTGPCDPCSRMEVELGEGGYNAMRGLGGITARITIGGWLGIGDRVEADTTR
jgi:MOSC domain-containing protein YiiM